jgi:epoxyqueuosine reductase QueG
VAVDAECLSPLAAFLSLYPQGAQAQDLYVMVLVLPQTVKTIKEQNKTTYWPGEGWARSRAAHDKAVHGLARHLQSFLEAKGIEAVVPDLTPTWRTKPSSAYQITSLWSHRHAGFMAGLGTFGLCDGLITKVGKAHRMTSLVVRNPLPVTPRSYADHDFRRDCLWFNSGSCGLCVKRCPAGAITESGHDKLKCSDFLKASTPYIETHWPDLKGAYACGLCQSHVPCAVRTPKVLAKPQPQSV